MYVAKMTFRYSRRFNLGDYQSLDLSIMPTVNIEEHDDLNEVSREVWAMCRANIEHAAAPIVQAGNGGTTRKELFLGLPLELTEKKELNHADNRTD